MNRGAGSASPPPRSLPRARARGYTRIRERSYSRAYLAQQQGDGRVKNVAEINARAPLGITGPVTQAATLNAARGGPHPPSGRLAGGKVDH